MYFNLVCLWYKSMYYMLAYLILVVSTTGIYKLTSVQTSFWGWGALESKFHLSIYPAPALHWEWASPGSSFRQAPWANSVPLAKRKWLMTTTWSENRAPSLADGFRELLNYVKRMGMLIFISLVLGKCGPRPGYLGHWLKWRLLSPVMWMWIPIPGYPGLGHLGQVVRPLCPQFLHLCNGCDGAAYSVRLLKGVNY